MYKLKNHVVVRLPIKPTNFDMIAAYTELILVFPARE